MPIVFVFGHAEFLKRVLILQRQLPGIGSIVLVERSEDLLPDAGGAPAVIAAVDGLPGAEVLRQVAPGGSGPRHPEHAREDGAVVVGRTTTVGFLRGQERGDPCPARIGELRDGGAEDLDRERALRLRLLARPTRRVAAPGDCLVPAPKVRPGEPKAEVVGWLGEGEQQAADFRHGERDQALSTPFFPALAWSRVTSK